MGRRAILLFFLGMALAASAPAQNPQGPPIVRSIDVEYSGPATVSKERILAQMRTTVGQPYSEPVVEQDVADRAAFGLGCRDRRHAAPTREGGRKSRATDRGEAAVEPTFTVSVVFRCGSLTLPRERTGTIDLPRRLVPAGQRRTHPSAWLRGAGS